MLQGRWVKNVTTRMKHTKNAELFSSPFAPLPTVLSVMCRALKPAALQRRKLHPQKHNGRATRQECDVTCWKQLCGCECMAIGARLTATDKRGKSSNTSLKVGSGLWGTSAARPEQSHLAAPGPL